MSNGLFRKEAIEHSRQKLWGDVIVVQPLSTTIMVAVLVALVGLAIGALAFGSYARTETALGYLVPDRGVAKIYAAQSGVISTITSREGDRVNAGTPMATVVVEQATTSGRSAEAQALALIDQQLVTLDERLEFERTRGELEQRRLENELANLARERAELEAQRKVQMDITKSAQESFNDLTELVEKGYVSKSEYERRRQTYLSQQQLGRELDQRLVGLDRKESETRLALEQLPTDLSDKVARLSNEMAELRQRQAEIEGKQAYSITAPISGRVAAVQASVGEVADPRLPLFTVLPEGGTLEADLYVPSRAIGFVKEGQEVRLLYDAFPYQRFGTYMGTVKMVTKTIIAPEESSAPFALQEPAYRVKVTLNRQDVDAFGDLFPLQPGMTLQARIVLERQNLMARLLEPLRAVGSGG